ncbi:Ran-specific GTPase-activating protein 30 [Ophidiomyces ophidiicola]|uniref:Ran-specific GTPase-activating protein 30 n=1 Tax=Ophidiomyces ophidiicola TaxID=1387563 RepID=A0ACB8V3S6_9EURO|nr:Ran-specific GTPase-activating protein 30 [Ophidiomyces ophidiicola]KAI1954678.1 Ran-specific GTPase-activating protein 30 [Ophidiomyces ophidiicola]KAI2007578.1 Ran-specific GTPase-activating protein 30 [Ophidiomyces ophidiicola]KAI2039262.1 Ran-specific GTPase-activating protein 30 [Ophidiomyces ophidiicola]KAI2071334.1 Ran-specific GTPase-activating protein 30 [Ophidiomyces ophidiicola]
MAGLLSMDKVLLTYPQITGQAMNYAVRSGIRVTGQYAISQVSRLMRKSANIDDTDRDELQALQERLQAKIRIISPAIDMIELIAARGNTSLESAVTLTKGLRLEIQTLGQRLANVASKEELSRKGIISTTQPAKTNTEITLIIKDIRRLLGRIEDTVPLINLAITTSGASLSTTLPPTVSPARLLQASTFLTTGDTQYSASPARAVQIGPTFILSIYLLFAGHARPHDEETIRNTTWKEVIHKARLKLRRIPMELLNSHPLVPAPPLKTPIEGHIRGKAKGDEFAYQILVIEDLDDGRVHTFDSDNEGPCSFEDITIAGIRETIPLHQISKIFYADTGKILNIGSEGEANHPVLLLKRDVNAIPPRKMIDEAEAEYDDFIQNCPDSFDSTEGESSPSTPAILESPLADRWRFPPDLDLEWIAFEVYSESEDSDSEDESDSQELSPIRSPTNPRLGAGLSKLRLDEDPQSSQVTVAEEHLQTVSDPRFRNIKSSLSLLEMLLRLTSLQQFQQQSHLSCSDELLNFFLEESSTTGAGGDENHRRRVRAEARRKVGWDPYDESPVKRRGEEYQYQAGHDGNSWARGSPHWQSSAGPYTPSTTPLSKDLWSIDNGRRKSLRGVVDGNVTRERTVSPSPNAIPKDTTERGIRRNSNRAS